MHKKLEHEAEAIYAGEDILLGTLILYPDLIAQVADKLKPQDFFRAEMGAIYEILVAYALKRKDVHVELVRQFGTDKITGLVDNAVPTTPERMQSRASDIKNLSILRRSRRIGTELCSVPTIDELKHLYAELSDGLDTTGGKPFSHVSVDALKFLEHVEQARRTGRRFGLLTGFSELDRLTAGLMNGELMIFGAMTSTGKTTFALDVAWNISEHYPVGFFSVEMSKKPVYMKLNGMIAGIDVEKLRWPERLTDADMELLSNASIEISKRKLSFDFFSMELQELLFRARRLRMETDMQFMVVDYCQLISSTEGQNRERQVAMIPEALKGLAKDLDIPILLLAQLNRQSVERKDNEPEMWHLRESGALEQGADTVLLAWRDFGTEGVTHFKLAKNRGVSRTGKFDLLFNLKNGRYESMEMKRAM